MLPLSRRFIVPVLLLGDLALVAASCFAWPHPSSRAHPHPGLLWVTYAVAAYLNGLMDVEFLRLRGRIVTGIAGAAALHAILLSSICFFIGAAHPPRVFVTLAAREFVLVSLWRTWAFFALFSVRKTPVLTIGPKSELDDFNSFIGGTQQFSFEHWARDYAEASTYLRASRIDGAHRAVVVSRSMLDSQRLREFFEFMGAVPEGGVERMYALPNALQVLLAGNNLRAIVDYPLVPLLRPVPVEQAALYRCVDIAVSLMLLVLSSPVLALSALSIKLSSPGPVLFRQTRVGYRGRHFSLFKLRTMRLDAEKETGPVLSWSGDSRVFPLGRLLRKLRIDELPQLINVLRGEMTLFGPRPERPEFVHQLARDIPGYDFRHFVKPGVTGLAQTVGGYRTDASRKLMFDLRHLAQDSAAFRADLFIKTLKTVLTAKGT